LEATKISNCRNLLIVTLFVFLAFSFCLYSEHYVFAQTDQTAKLQAANSAIGQAFNTVLDAEKAGANVTQLLGKLNTAGEILAEAQNAYKSGNTANITSNVENARQIAEQVNSDALNLQNVSIVESQNSFLLTMTFSIVGTVVFVVSLLFVWRRFKRFFVQKLFGMKPGVVGNTT
jgi:hypothetical protein